MSTMLQHAPSKTDVKPRIRVVLTLHEPMRWGEKSELSQWFNLRRATYFTLMPCDPPQRGPWSPAVQELASLIPSPILNNGDILIVSPWGSYDVYRVFELLADGYGYCCEAGFGLSPAKMISAMGTDERQVHRLINGANKLRL